MKTQNEQRKLKALVRELEHELSEGKSQLQALSETQERLQQAERICQELMVENRQLREEIADWQKRVAANEQYQEEISILKQQLDALQSEHDALLRYNHRVEQQVNLQREPDLSSSDNNDSAHQMSSESAIDIAAATPSDFAGATNTTDAKLGDPGAGLGRTIAVSLLPRSILQNWRFGAIAAAIIAIAIAGMSIHLRSSDSPSSTPAPTETATDQEPVTIASPRPSVAPPPRVRGTFQTVRPTQVFSEPSEDSALVASIAKGVRLNVIDSREGWLEIRSKHGRPPGFIRREEAVRVGAN